MMMVEVVIEDAWSGGQCRTGLGHYHHHQEGEKTVNGGCSSAGNLFILDESSSEIILGLENSKRKHLNKSQLVKNITDVK